MAGWVVPMGGTMNFASAAELGYASAPKTAQENNPGGTMKPRRGIRVIRAGAIIIALAGAFATSAPNPTLAQQGTTVTTPSGLKITDTQVGTGAQPKTGQTCVMHYTGWLYTDGAKGQKFDSSVDRGEPFEFSIGTGQVIGGWDEGVATMKV